jgi:hypothetical protein
MISLFNREVSENNSHKSIKKRTLKLISLRSRRYSRARENGKLEIPPAQKLHILSSPAAGCRSILIGQNVDFECFEISANFGSYCCRIINYFVIFVIDTDISSDGIH